MVLPHCDWYYYYNCWLDLSWFGAGRKWAGMEMYIRIRERVRGLASLVRGWDKGSSVVMACARKLTTRLHRGAAFCFFFSQVSANRKIGSNVFDCVAGNFEKEGRRAQKVFAVSLLNDRSCCSLQENLKRVINYIKKNFRKHKEPSVCEKYSWEYNEQKWCRTWRIHVPRIDEGSLRALIDDDRGLVWVAIPLARKWSEYTEWTSPLIFITNYHTVKYKFPVLW